MSCGVEMSGGFAKDDMVAKIYRSPFEAYPFLSEASTDLRCDYELATDAMASEIGVLAALIEELITRVDGPFIEADEQVFLKRLKSEQLWMNEIVYHLNACVRCNDSIKEAELNELLSALNALRAMPGVGHAGFVLPQGCVAACQAHRLRVRAKMLVRLLYRLRESGVELANSLIDAFNLLSGYYFYLALYLNKASQNEEHNFVSRHYN